MDRASGNAGRARGRAGGTNPPGNGGGRGRRHGQAPQSSGSLPGPEVGGSAPSAWGGGGARGANRGGAAQSSAGPPSAWGNPNAGRRGVPTSGPQPAKPPTASAWGNPNNGASRGGAPQTSGNAQRPQESIASASVWGNPNVGGARGTSRGGAVMGATQPTGISQQRAPAPVTLGRATTHRDVPVAEAQGAVSVEESRGNVRGKRVIMELVHSKPQDLPTKLGKAGDKLLVQTNYFRILKKPAWAIHQYRVDFSPDVDHKRIRCAYLAHHKQLFGGYIFDGTVLFSANYFIDHAENGQRELITKNREGETIQIKIKHVGIVDVSDAQQIQVLNLILRRAIEGLNLQLVARNYFDPTAKINLENYRMEIWPGYQTSIRQHERDILLCAEIAHKVMRTQTLYQILTDCSRDFSDFQAAFKRQVIGSVVLTDYNNKTYRVDDVDFKCSPMSTFDTKDGPVTYMEYYKKRYNLTIRDQKQPMLISRPKERNIRGGQNDFIMLIPELCRATGLTDAMKTNFRLMRDMSEHTRLSPQTRIARLLAFNRRLLSSATSVEVFRSWDMDVDKNLVEIPGRKLAYEKIVFGDNRKITLDKNVDWSREFRSTKMYTHVDIKRWYVIVPRRNLKEIQEFVRNCIKAASFMKMHISEPRYEEMPDDRNGSYSQAIEKTTAQDPQILLIVMVSNNEDKYSCIKKKCCVDRPIPSQVCTLRTVAPRQAKSANTTMSIATKVVIQMNAKLMGAPWLIELPLSGLMTVGFDVCHSGKEKNTSYGALVATMDMKLTTKYFSAVTAHLKGQELSNEISVKMTCALKAYRAQHGTLPDRILFYRDGVGDSQLHQVFGTEVKFLKNKLDEIYKSAGIEKGCRLAFIIVSKRINTRFFVNQMNPLPGTVVDDVITLPERYDFFLISQSVGQGTVSPTSYNVIFDNFGLDPDKIQTLTYKMTHLYYNWSGTLRVPAVCQYAHKLAFLVAESIHRAPSNVLENQLYFL